MRLRHFLGIIAVVVLFMGSGCNMDYRSTDDGGGGSSSTDTSYTRLASIRYLKSSDIDVRAELITDKNGDNVLKVSHEEQEYMYYRFTKRGSDNSDEADTDGTNAAVLANDSATLTIRDSLVFSSGDHAHGVFSHGDGTSLVVSDCVISAMGGNSSGVVTASSANAVLHHVTAETFGASSPVLRVRNGGGSLTAERGKYSSYGTDSPVLLSEGTITISGAKIEAAKSRAVVIQGKSSVSITSCDISTEANSAVMIYRQASGNSVANPATFTITQGTIDCDGDEVFYVTNTAADITLNNTDIADGPAFLRAEASDWGTSGVNGGQVNLNLIDQYVNGDIYLDGVSDLNMYLTEESYFEGAIHKTGTSSRIYVSLTDSRWVLTGDSYVDSLSCEENSITLNGYSLYVGSTLYEAGTYTTGTEIDFASDRSAKTTDDNNGDNNGDDNGDDNGGDDNGGDNGGDDNNNGIESPDVEDTRLSFDTLIYTTGTVNSVAYRAYSDVVYVTSPVISDCQKLSVYIPEPYFSSRAVNGYTAQTAPIFVPNDSAGYMAASIMTPQDSNIIGLALSKGMVVVSPALRGRNVSGGTAPAAIVDYKAAIRYIRANKNRLPAGNTDRIIACGVSSGGALAALLGASGNAGDYNEYFYDIGAADADDNIFAAVCYCPVTNLENADGAYEWVFGGEKYGTDSVALTEDFESYVNGMGLVKNGVDLVIYDYDTNEEYYEEGQTFRRYLEGLYVQAAQKAIDSGTSINVDWLTVSNDVAISADIWKYADSFTVRQKTIPAFDKFDLSSPENSEFNYKHFTDFSAQHVSSVGEKADTLVIWEMNPMEYIGNADTCRFWRIRHGVNDRDIAITIPALLALKLESEGFSVDFSAAWGQGHAGYYDTDELFAWIDSICK